MSFWGVLGNIGKGLVGLGGGGNTNKIVDGVLSGLGAVGPVLSGAAKGASGERLAENQQGMSLAQLGMQGARDQFSSDLALSNAQFGSGLQGAQFDREGQSRAQKQALLSALIGGLQDASITPGNPAIAARMPTMTGGLRPSAIAGQKDALMALLGQAQTAAPTYAAPKPYQAPGLPELDEGGAFENILGGAGLATSVLGALGNRKSLKGAV